MFIQLTNSENKPLYVNANHIICFFESNLIPDCNSFIRTVDGKHLYVKECVDDFVRFVRPVNISPMCEVSEEKLPLDTPLEDLGLSKRAENILSKLGVQTIGDISDALNPKNHKFVRGLGSVTMTEIIQKYQACGYKFDWLP